MGSLFCGYGCGFGVFDPTPSAHFCVKSGRNGQKCFLNFVKGLKAERTKVRKHFRHKRSAKK